MTYAAFHSRGTSDNDSTGQSSDEKRQDIPLSGGRQPCLVSRVYFWSLYRIWRRLTRSSSAARVCTPPVRASAVWMYRCSIWRSEERRVGKEGRSRWWG